MNIYNVSQQAGVSIATVSRVLNCNPNVSAKTRQKVLEVMDELGYTPNIFARGLGLNTMKTIGILCLDSSDPFLANAVYNVEQNLRKYDYDVLLCCTGYDLSTKQKYLNLLISKRVDAVILVGSSFLEPVYEDNSYLFEAADTVPLVMLYGYIEHPNIYCSICDDYQSIFHATSRLLRSGRNDILFLYRSSSYCGVQRLSGYKDALIAYGRGVKDSHIIFCRNNLEHTKRCLIDAHNQGLCFDAVVAAEDFLAVATLKYAKECNISVPKDLSVIGYNNSILSVCCEPELTTIDNHIESVCDTAINTLMRVLEGSDVPNKTTVSNSLIIRDSTDF